MRPPRRNPSGAAMGFVGGLIGGVVIAAVVAVAIFVAWPSIRAQIMPPPDNHEAVFADLDHRIAALEGAAGKSAGDKATLADIAKRIAALEQTSHAAPPPDPRVAALTDKIEQLAGQIAALQPTEADKANMQQLVAQAQSAAQSARDAASQRQSAEALLIVIGQLRDAVERGGSYAPELAAARKVAPDAAGQALDQLAANADSGVAPRDQLIDSFPAVASAISRAALGADAADGFWARLEHEASTLISIRRVDGQGNDPASIAARAEKAAKRGDLESAVKELAALDGTPAGEAKGWIAAAQARLNAERALSDLSATAAAALKTGQGN